LKIPFTDDISTGSLVYHEGSRAGKLEIRATKPLGNQRDLALAYSPGVAAVSMAIHAVPETAVKYTTKANLVAVITNGTAVLGLGNIGPLAAKPVMEGKAVLFKKFADIDVFDLELEASAVDTFVNAVATMEPTFGGINLEDIKAPECFEIEEQLKSRMNIPVFHDDQHGTAVIVGAAVINALHLTGKSIDTIKIVASGAGAAALACLNLLVSLGAKRENIWVTDLEGVVFQGRIALMDKWKAKFAQDTNYRRLDEVLPRADVFLGLSAGNILKPEMLHAMAPNPLILALANPTPEIMPDVATAARPDAIVCTGRSDYPNQVNNVLCFPYIFRGALDVGATSINEDMKLAAVNAIAALARETPSDVSAMAYAGDAKLFGRESIIPTPFDPRLILWIAPAVAEAAMKSGVATRPLQSVEAYRDSLNRFVFRSGLVMRNVFVAARKLEARVVYADGEDERVLRAAQVVIADGIARPILVGRPKIIDARIERYGLSIELGRDVDIINPEDDPRYRDYVSTLVEVAGRRGITPDVARVLVRTSTTTIAALAVYRGDADAMLCGLEGRFRSKLRSIQDIIGLAPEAQDLAAMSLLITARGPVFFADTHIQANPTPAQIAATVAKCVQHMRRFGIVPQVALVSHSDFGDFDTDASTKMRSAVNLIKSMLPDLSVDGEMQADTALLEELRRKKLPSCELHGEANLLVFPNLESANASYQMAKVFGDALPVGPILLGARLPSHILTGSVTSRGVVNMTAIAAAEVSERLR
jgi:malate dehydrogenase (oxaloacetate-decarboxylating)(NADP+)